MPFFKRRLFEYILPQMIMSVVFTYSFTHNILAPTYAACLIIMLMCFIGNMIYQYTCLVEYLFSLESYRAYFKVNITVVLIYAIACAFFAYLNVEPFYTYLFMSYKALTFLNLSKVASAIILNLLMLTSVFLVPVLFKLDNNDKNEIFIEESDIFDEFEYFSNK